MCTEPVIMPCKYSNLILENDLKNERMHLATEAGWDACVCIKWKLSAANGSGNFKRNLININTVHQTDRVEVKKSMWKNE